MKMSIKIFTICICILIVYVHDILIKCLAYNTLKIAKEML